MSDADNATPTDDNKLIAERRAKLTTLRQQGNPFPNDFRRSAMAADLQSRFGDESKENLEQADQHFAVAGRLIRNRGAFFIDTRWLGHHSVVYQSKGALLKPPSMLLKVGIWVTFVAARRAFA
jgi:Lysyl-tRNA synthetase (class II)